MYLNKNKKILVYFKIQFLIALLKSCIILNDFYKMKQYLNKKPKTKIII